MEAYFQLEDFVKCMLLKSDTEEGRKTWQHILDLNKRNANNLYIN